MERFAHPSFGRARYSVARNTYLACPEKRRPNRPECNGTGERRRSDGDPGEPSNGAGARAGGGPGFQGDSSLWREGVRGWRETSP